MKIAIKDIILFVFGTCGVGTAIVAYIKTFKKRLSATEKGVQALLRAEIIRLYNKYIELKVIPIYERENLEHLFVEYKALGGNGVIESLKEKLDELPTS